MKNNRLSLVVCFLLILTGCSKYGLIGELPVLSQGDPGSKCVIIRRGIYSGSLKPYYVAIDGNDIISFRGGSYAVLQIPSGKHELSVRCFGDLLPTWDRDSISFTATSGGKNFFEIRHIFSLKIREISEGEAEAYLNEPMILLYPVGRQLE